MGRTWKKAVSLLLIVCMIAMLAACDSGDDAGNGSGENKTSQTTPGGAKAAKTLTGTGKLSDTPTPTPTDAAGNVTPTPTDTVWDVTPTPTDTVQGVTPTAEVAPTQQITPTPFDDDPNAQYEIFTMPYAEGNDTRRLSFVSITRTTDKGSEKVFDSEEYIEAHKAEWEAEAASRIRQLKDEVHEIRNSSPNAALQVFVNERKESRIPCGSTGLLEVYSHAGAYGELYEEELKSAYTVSCWLVLPDMTKQYLVLYEYMPEKREGTPEQQFSFEMCYENESDGKSLFDAGAVRKVLTVAGYREDTPGNEEWDDDSIIWETYYATDVFGKLRLLIRWCCWKEGTTEWSRTESGWMFTSDNDIPYSLMQIPWKVFDSDVLEIYDSMKQLENGEIPAIPGFAEHVKDGVYSDSRIIDDRFSLRVTVEYFGDDVKTSVYVTGGGLDVLVDESRRRLLDVFTSETGEKLEICGLSGDSRSGYMGSQEYNGFTDGSFIIRYYPAGAEKPSLLIDLNQYAQQNQEMFDSDHTLYGGDLWQKYNGPILMSQHAYETYSLGSFGKLYIIGTAGCGQVPRSHVKISGYEVDCIWVRDGELVSQAWLYKGWGSEGTTEGASDYMNISFHTAQDPEGSSGSENYMETSYLKSYAPDCFRNDTETVEELSELVTMVCFGAKQTEHSQTGNTERYESVRAVFDPEGKYLLRVYTSRHDSGNGYVADDGSVQDAFGGAIFHRGTDGTWKILSYTLEEIAAAFEKAADPNFSGKVADGIMDHVITGENEDTVDYVFCDHVSLDDKTELFALAVCNEEHDRDCCDVGFVIVRGGKVLTVEYMQLPFGFSGGK